MGRPRKQTVDYFPHYVSTDSRTKFILEQNWGNDGYAFWFKLLELLGRSEGHYYDYSIKANVKYLIAISRTDEKTANEILETLVELGSIDKELWEKHRIIWCNKFVENLQDVYAKRMVSAPNKPFTEITEDKQEDREAETREAFEEEKQEDKNDITEQTGTTEENKIETKSEEEPEKAKEKEENKINYAEFVRMTKEEYQKLIGKYGAERTALAIEMLDNYKGANGKKYKSDYRAILNWVIEKASVKFNNGGGKYGENYSNAGITRQSTGNPREFKPSKGFKR